MADRPDPPPRRLVVDGVPARRSRRRSLLRWSAFLLLVAVNGVLVAGVMGYQATKFTPP